MTDRELKPCPFCGDKMEVSIGHTLRHVVQTEGCPIAQSAWPVERLDWWNTRAALRPEAQDGVAEAAKVLLEHTPNPVFDILKPILIGEYAVRLPDIDEHGDEYYRNVNVPWDVQKQIIGDALRALAGDRA